MPQSKTAQSEPPKTSSDQFTNHDSASRRRLLSGAGVGLLGALALSVYAATLAPTVTLIDSGELITAAHTLGVAHPPGFPVYLLLTHLVTLVPMGNVAERANFASALFAALAVSAVTLACLEALRDPAVASKERKRDKRKQSGSRKSAAPMPDETLSSLETLAGALIAGALFAFSRTLWSYATVAEVYTLNALLIALVFLLMLKWRSDQLSGRDGAPSDRGLYLAAFLFGLGLGIHHVTVGLILPGLAILVFLTAGSTFFKSLRLLFAALFSFAGLAAYAYLPAVAATDPLMNWGDPVTFERFIWHVTGKQYSAFFSFSPEVIGSQLTGFMTILFREFSRPWLPLGLIMAAIGFVDAFKRNRALFWFLSVIVICDVVYGLGYEIAEDKDAYYLPAFIGIILAASRGAAALLKLFKRSARGARRRWIGLTALLLAPVVAFGSNLPYNDRSSYFIARDYVENILSTVEPGGMLLTQDWQVYSPLLYLREIEGVRKDVIALDVNHIRRSPWYFDYLAQVYPELVEQNREKIDAFLKDLLHFQREPEAFSRNPALIESISSNFFGLLESIVRNQMRSGKVYVTIDIAADRSGMAENAEFTKFLATNYQIVPAGLVFEATQDRSFRPQPPIDLRLRGLNDGTLKFDEGDVVRLKVLPVYVTMLINRGRYLASRGEKQEAIACYQKALELDPSSGVARQMLSGSP